MTHLKIRGVALLFIYLTSALDEDGWSTLRPGRLMRYSLYRRLGGPQGRSGRVSQVSTPTAFDPRTVQLVASRYNDYAVPTHRKFSTLV